jgi:DNA-binding SARP family transcriptional activator
MQDWDVQNGKLWRVRLFGGPALIDGAGNEYRRFRSQRVGALLAYLCLNLGKPCPREQLCDALWPEEPELSTASNRLRVTLASLRRLMEPAPTQFGAILDVSEPGRIRLRSEAVWCDAIALEEAVRQSTSAVSNFGQGDFLPGYYDEWIIEARERFEALREEIDGESQDSGPAAVSAPNGPRPTQQHRLPLYLRASSAGIRSFSSAGSCLKSTSS